MFGLVEYAAFVTVVPLYLVWQPETEYFSSSAITVPFGNTTVQTAFVTSNPAGLSAGNSVTFKVFLTFSENISAVPGVLGVAVIPNDAYPIIENNPFPTYSAYFQLQPTDSKGYDWSGTEQIAYSSYGTLGITVFVITGFESNGGIAGESYTTSPFIQVQAPIVTLEYLTDIILLILEVVVVVLIAYEIRSNREGNAQQRRTEQTDP